MKYVRCQVSDEAAAVVSYIAKNARVNMGEIYSFLIMRSLAFGSAGDLFGEFTDMRKAGKTHEVFHYGPDGNPEA